MMYRFIFFFIALLALSVIELSAQFKFIDSSFGGDGGIRTDVTNYTDLPLALAYRSNDRILVLSQPIGLPSDTRPQHYSLIQYHSSNGRLDRSFGNQGIATVPIKMSSQCFLTSMHLADDGTVLLVGADSAREKLFLTRYTSAGVPDPSFGINGVVFSEDGWIPSDFVVLPNRKIVVVGWGKKPGFVDGPFVVRFNEDGSLDSSFGSDGVTDFRGRTLFKKIVPLAVEVQKNGNLILAAELTISKSNTTYQGLIRCLPDGTFDTAFGERGKIAIGATTEDINVSHVIVIPDSLSILCSSMGRGFIVRFSADGVVDSSFGAYGRLYMNMEKSSVTFLTIQSDGSILASGSNYQDDFEAIYLGRYHSDGSVDYGFGNSGTILSNAAYNRGGWHHLVQPDGRILVASNAAFVDLTILRFKAQKYTGAVDTHNSVTIQDFHATTRESEIILNFEMDHFGSVTPVLSDILGRRVILGDSKLREAGASSVQISIPPDLSAGSYVVSLIVDGIVSKSTLVNILQ